MLPLWQHTQDAASARSTEQKRGRRPGRLAWPLVLAVAIFALRPVAELWYEGASDTFVSPRSLNSKSALRGQQANAAPEDSTAVLDRPKVNGHRKNVSEASQVAGSELPQIQLEVPKEMEVLREETKPEFAAPWALVAALGLGLAMGLALSRPQLQAPSPAASTLSSPAVTAPVVLEKAANVAGEISGVADKAKGQMYSAADKAKGQVSGVADKVGKVVARLNEAESQEDQLLRYDDKLAKMYTGLMESARGTGARLQEVMQSIAAAPSEKGAPSRVSTSIVKKIRDIGDMLDEAQADVYKEEWLSLKVYPEILRAYLPLMEFYENQAFSDNNGDKQVNAATRASLRFYRLQMGTNLARLGKAIENQKVREVEEAFAKTSLAYDRFLKAGDLYTGYDPVTSTTVFFQSISDDQLRYTPLALQQPQIRDEVLVLQGPDKGKVGRIIWLGRENGEDKDSKVLTAVVKLEPNPVLGSGKNGGVREVKAYPYAWLVMTRGSDEGYIQDLILASSAAVISCAVTYPLETIKARVQSNLSPIPPEGPQALLNGVELNVLREAPNAGFLMAGFNYFTRFAVGLPFINGNDPNMKFLLMIPSGVVAMCSGAFVKAPVIDISKQVQAGLAADAGEAIQNVYFKPNPSQVSKRLARNLMLTAIRGVPFGAFQCFIYEVLKDQTPGLLETIGVPIWFEPFIWGGAAGFCTGYLTNPPDVIMQRLALEASEDDEDDTPFSVSETWEEIVRATQKAELLNWVRLRCVGADLVSHFANDPCPDPRRRGPWRLCKGRAGECRVLPARGYGLVWSL
ncbi:unnamed protein product [Effrenium voratum]|uniref:Uncharacterized protein n=1 Tax=Effrenium voratum TaxID=2562239 RepID=A0AA36MTQ9_9DINO|nr:unnamed protein product [Effrenium voratum]